MPNKPKHSHSDRDEIFTPENIVKELINNIPYDDEDIWCDPCYGQGVFYKNFPCGDLNKDFFEINMGKDFLKSNDKWDWIVTNIPFSKPKEFIFKMAESCEKGFGILCLANSMTATRLKKLEDMGLYLNSMKVIYIREWGFGYRTDFYVFTRYPIKNMSVIIE
tara:strand:- start:49 stop:537 length:489 start_codon:yes stop_codon:yes gene_type:complete